MTRAPHVYCAETSRGNGEPLVGTASFVDLWLLIECAAPWPAEAVRDCEHLGAALKEHLARAGERIDGLRVQLIQRGPEVQSERVAFVAVPDEVAPALYRVPFTADDELIALDLAAFARGDASVERWRTDQRVALVCTHGRHDACCARYGAALYHALEDHPGVEVWQSTHVGGDRFAANLVCLPDGLYFGRVDGASGRSILDAYVDGRVEPACYRGRCTYGRFTQAAECFVRGGGGPPGARALRLRACEGSGEARVVTFVEASGARHVARVRRVRDGRRAYLTCGSARPEPLFSFVLDGYEREEGTPP